MKCEHCGAEINEEWSCCPNCGYKITKSEMSKILQNNKNSYGLKIFFLIHSIPGFLLVYTFLNSVDFSLDFDLLTILLFSLIFPLLLPLYFLWIFLSEISYIIILVCFAIFVLGGVIICLLKLFVNKENSFFWKFYFWLDLVGIIMCIIGLIFNI